MKRRIANSLLLMGTGLLILSMLLSAVSFAAPPPAPRAAAGAIWTTQDDCGDITQDENHFMIGDEVFINGAGFDPGEYDWFIVGKPGGASCDPSDIVASGVIVIEEANEAGTFCIDAYTVQADDCGEYQVKVHGVKGDNYRVVGCKKDEDCDDGLFCTDDYCDPDGFCQYTDHDCSDGVDCTIDECDEDTDTCTNTPDDSYCDNGLWCDGEEYCDELLGCQPGTPVDCSDGVDCTVDECDEDTDTCTNTPDDSYCDNGLWCDGEEYCDELLGCQPGTPVDCSDGVDCTIDECDEVNNQCVNTPDHPYCDDGQWCNGAEYCHRDLDCQPGTPVDCSDGVDCTVDECDEDTDTCTNTPDDSYCDNGLWCDGEEYCDELLGCQPGTPVDCDDANICTDDSCDEDADECDNVFDVTNHPTCEPCFGVDCDDGLWCNGLETCEPGTGECLPGTPPDCSDDLFCTINERCDETADACISDPRDCSDDLFCTVNERCDETADACVSDPRVCSDDLFCTVNERCDEAADACVSDPRDCSDDLFCTINEVCDEVIGACMSDPRDCDDADICTDDSCDEAADACVNVFDATNDPSCAVAPVLSGNTGLACSSWWANFSSNVTAEYYVKVFLDGNPVFEEGGFFSGTKSFLQYWYLWDTGDRTMRIIWHVKAGAHQIGDDRTRTRDCGAPPPPPPPPPPTPTPTPIVEVLAVERLPVTGSMAALPAFPSLALTLSSLALISGGLLLRRKE